MDRKKTPPRLLTLFLEWFFRSDRLDEIYGDLIEIFHEDVERMPLWKARWRFVFGSLLFFKPVNFKFIEQGKQMILFHNYLLIARRNLIKNKGYTLFNLTGFSIGLIASLFIMVYVIDEHSYDKQYSRSNDIYRVVQHIYMENDEMHAAVTPGAVGFTMKEEIPEIEDYAVFTHFNRITFNIGKEKFTDPDGRIVSSSILKVFDFPLLSGDPLTAFSKPNSLVLSESRAMNYFGSLDILGKTVETDHFGKMTITGIMKDPVQAGHFHHHLLFYVNDDFFDKSDWGDHSFYTYVLIKKGSSLEDIKAKLPTYHQKYLAETVSESFAAIGDIFLQKITDIHLSSALEFEIEPNSNSLYVKTLIALAIFVLIVVCINYTNMATAQATRRVKEVGIRKVLGSNGNMILQQFLTESIIVVFSAAILSFLFIPLLIPSFNYMADKSFEASDFLDAGILFYYFILILSVGIISGSYPSIFLSGFKMDEVLKKSYSLGKFKMPASKVLNGIQFAAALIMILVTLTVRKQIEYAKNKDLGFNSENVFKVALNNRIDPDRLETFRTELMSVSGILEVGLSKQTPGDDLMSDGLNFEKPDGTLTNLKSEFNAIDEHFLSVLDIPLIAGRNFGDNTRDKWGHSAIVNKTLVKSLGYENVADILEKKVKLPLGEDHFAKIIGVVEDAHLQSLHDIVSPHIMVNFIPIASILLVKANDGNIDVLYNQINEKIAAITGSSSHTITLLDNDYWAQYQADEKQHTIFSAFTTLTILLSFAGLIGLVSFNIRFKAREINIRKILGAKFRNVFSIIIRQYAVQLILSISVAIPLAIYLADLWLNSFMYRIEKPIGLLAISTLVLLFTILMVIAIQCQKSYISNPTKYLNEE